MNIPGVSLNGRPLPRYAIVRSSTFEHDRKRQRAEAMKRRRALIEAERVAQQPKWLAECGLPECPSVLDRIAAVYCYLREFWIGGEFYGDVCPNGLEQPAEFQAWFRRAIEV